MKALYSKTSLHNLPIGRRDLAQSRRSPAKLMDAHNSVLPIKTGQKQKAHKRMHRQELITTAQPATTTRLATTENKMRALVLQFNGTTVS
jgi:hypothetical protein